MGRIYTFLLNSDIAGNANANCRYFIDFEVLPANKRFKVSFTFMSATGVLTNTEVANVYIDLGQSKSVIANSEFVQTGFKSSYIGSLRWAGTAVGQLSASTTDNAPIWLDKKPPNNIVKVEIHQNTSAINTDYAPVPEYSLTLSFEEQPDF